MMNQRTSNLPAWTLHGFLMALLSAAIAAEASAETVTEQVDDALRQRVLELLRKSSNAIAPYETQYSETIWAGDRVSEQGEPVDHAEWSSFLRIHGWYGTHRFHLVSEGLFPDGREDATQVYCSQDGVPYRIVQQGGRARSMSVGGRLHHPGFGELPLWFNPVADRYAWSMPSAIRAIEMGQVLAIAAEPGAYRCRLYQIDPNVMQTELLIDAVSGSVSELEQFYSVTDADPRAFEDRITNRTIFRVTRWSAYGDGLNLPAEAEARTLRQDAETKEWIGTSYTRYVRDFVSPAPGESAEPCTTALTDGLVVRDERTGASYVIGRSGYNVDGTSYTTEEPVRELLPIDLPGMRELTVAGNDQSPSGSAFQTDPPGWSRILWVGLLFGIGVGMLSLAWVRLRRKRPELHQ